MAKRIKYYSISCYLGIFLLSLTHITASAASLELVFTDPTGQPIEHTVVSLTSETPLDTSEQTTALMDQRNKQFAPHVLAVRTNTLVYFPNHDDIGHHVYSFSPAKRFELRLYHGTDAEPVLFDQPGQVVLGCNIHDAMLGYIYVVDSEWFAVSDSMGQARITGVPAGTYRLHLQHPRLTDTPAATTVHIISDDQYIQQSIRLPTLQPDPRQSQPEFDYFLR
jgi:plastocyanin